MSDQGVVRFPVSVLVSNAFKGVVLQVHRLGERLTEEDFRAYIKGDGPTSEFVQDDAKVVNPARSKVWHLGRVKYFYQRFVGGVAVDPVEIAYYPNLGLVVSDGSHRVLGAFFADNQELDVVASPLAVSALEIIRKAKRD